MKKYEKGMWNYTLHSTLKMSVQKEKHARTFQFFDCLAVMKLGKTGFGQIRIEK